MFLTEPPKGSGAIWNNPGIGKLIRQYRFSPPRRGNRRPRGHSRRVGSVRHFVGILLGLLVVLPCGPAAGSVQLTTAHSAPQAVAGVSGSFVAVGPVRIADTRANSGFPDEDQVLSSGGSINVQVAGEGGVPTAGVSAAVLNVTAVDPSAATFLTVFPEGSSRPTVANLNIAVGQTVANLVTVPVGAQGGVTIFNHAGTGNVVVDLDGYYTASPQATGLYNPVNPVRVFGSLTSGVTIGPGASAPVAVTGGTTGVPADASSVVVNITAADSSEASFLTAFPAPNSGVPEPPKVANVNFEAGQIIGNRVMVSVGPNGDVEIYNHAGSVLVDVDLYGYYTGTPGDLGSTFDLLEPARFVDTRVAVGGSTVGGVDDETFGFLPDGVPINATAIAANVTVVSGTSGGYLTIYPTTESTPPVVGDIAIGPSAVDQNFSVAPLNSASLRIFNSSATPVNIIIDAFGYFAPPPPAVHVVPNPASLAANGSSSSVLTVTVTTGSGIAFDDPVSITTTPSVAGACGTASATGSTNAFGQVTSTYTASTTPGACTITATEANGGTTGTAVITQTPT
jgi:hypothetical protein